MTPDHIVTWAETAYKALDVLGGLAILAIFGCFWLRMLSDDFKFPWEKK